MRLSPGRRKTGTIIEIIDGVTGLTVSQFTVPNVPGEGSTRVSIAAADFAGLGHAQIAVGSRGVVRVFDAITGKPVSGPLAGFTPFGKSYSGAIVSLAASNVAGDVNGDGIPDLIV